MHYLFISIFLFSLFCKADEVSFMSYNLKNFLEMYTYTNGQKTGARYKPDEEIEALVNVIAQANPDVLGICEIGNREDLALLRKHLSKAGLQYDHIEHVKAADSVRHLALLSKYPINANHSKTDLFYSIGKTKFPLRRGLLHVELKVGKDSIHALGVHFKSKRPVDYADESMMRLKEAHLARDVVDNILKDNPDVKLFIYGDFNDSYKSEPISAIKGHYRSKVRLEPLQLKDTRGEYWTHYWSWERNYSVFDYVFCSRSLLPLVDINKSYIIDTNDTEIASDHRPLLVTFKLGKDK